MNVQAITVRKLEVPHGPDAPALARRWFLGSAPHTAAIDALCLLFPDGERFFVRSVKHFEARIPEHLREDVRRFAAQEAWHGRAHRQVADLLEAQGFRVEHLMARFERIVFQTYAPLFTPEVQLAATAAAEHLTATLAELVIVTDLIELADPVMRDLLQWHAVEELEHRAVAFDVLQAVDPRWTTRMAGLAAGFTALWVFWLIGGIDLARQERRLPPPNPLPAAVPLRTRLGRLGRTLAHVGRSLAAYVKPSFHPALRPLPDLSRWSPGILNQVQSKARAAQEAV